MLPLVWLSAPTEMTEISSTFLSAASLSPHLSAPHLSARCSQRRISQPAALSPLLSAPHLEVRIRFFVNLETQPLIQPVGGIHPKDLQADAQFLVYRR